MPRRVLATVEALKQARTLKFIFSQEGIRREGFLVHHMGSVFAYENVCRHIPISLDYGDGEFFTRDGTHLYCQTHGAMYNPATGFCVEGPCAGASLKAVSIEIEGELVLLGPGLD